MCHAEKDCNDNGSCDDDGMCKCKDNYFGPECKRKCNMIFSFPSKTKRG